MYRRRAARAMVLLALYQLEVGHVSVAEALETVFSPTADEALQEFFSLPKRKPKTLPTAHDVQSDPVLKEYVENTVTETWNRRQQLDDVIRMRAKHWRPERMARTDLNILRMATFELTAQKVIPAAVTVNEAVELAKAFGEDDTGKFINGILGSIMGSESRALETGVRTDDEEELELHDDDRGEQAWE